jgi:O-antigen/teichoic acid export membrane protein
MKKSNSVAFFNILSVVLLNGISILTAPLFSRLLGDSGYGVFKIYNIWVSVAAILLTLQTQGTIVNARVEFSPEQQRKYHSSVMGLSVLVFGASSLLIALFIRPVSRFLQLEPMLVGLMLLQAFGTFCINFLNTRNTYEYRAGKNMAMSLAVSLTTIILSLLLVLRLPQEILYYGRIAAVAATYGVIGIPVCLVVLLGGKKVYDREFWRFCIVLAIPAVFHNLSDLILGQSDQVMLRHFTDAATVGHYGYAWNFSNILFVLFGALNRTWCPFFFDEMKEGRRDAMLAKTKNFLELFTVLASGFILLAPEVYHVYADRSFWPSTSVIPLFIISYYLNFLCTFPVNYEYYHKQTKVVAAVTIFSSLMNVMLNYFLIHSMGMIGAALATALSHGVQLILHHLYCALRLGRGDYPFPVKLWMLYPVCFGVTVAVVYVTGNLWLPRWGFGAVLGIWELLRIRKRRVLI